MRVVCLVLVLLAVAPHAVACTCPGIPFFDRAVAQDGSRYHAVFEGVVTDKRVSLGEDEYDGTWVPRIESEVTVVRLWKGNPARTILVAEGFGGCAGRFSAGSRYVFVADGYDAVTNGLSASVCSPTFRMTPARSPEITRTLGAPVAAFADVGAAQLPGTATEYRFRLRVYLVSGVAAARNLLIQPRVEITRWGWPAWAVAGIFLGGFLGVAGLLIATVGSRQTLTGWLLFIGGTLAAVPVVLAAAGYVYTEHTYLGQLVQWSWA